MYYFDWVAWRSDMRELIEETKTVKELDALMRRVCLDCDCHSMGHCLCDKNKTCWLEKLYLTRKEYLSKKGR